MIFFIMKSIQVWDLRAEIKFLHFLQMGEILAILFFCFSYRMCRLRQQIATVCAVYTSKVHTTACAAYASNLLLYASKTHNFTRFCYRMRRVRQQIATVCAVYASKLLPHALHTLANCSGMRRLRQQFATAYASKVLPQAPSTLNNSKYKCYSCLFQAMKKVFTRFCYRMRHIGQQIATVCKYIFIG